ncbi:signal peptidase I [Microbacterium ulmi]|uniref:Signal peptidase I n=1 Tax=Microbacterium ulmi TaxID=179095 RepID=A0A7Y2LXF3_9MICO|nr:signal peptidase I [Microbacterium ulmi]NII71220.1 signal peptidase I [Microbacterium ulmi]NNH02525.1 signal peptidase I [Microbacterium ulmi]
MTTEQTAPADPIPAQASVAPAPAPGRTRGRRTLLFLRDVVVIVLVAVVVSLVIKTFFVRSFYIPSASMEDTLRIDDRILVDEITPRFGGYDRGDVVVFRDPGGWLPPVVQEPRPPLVEAWDWVLSLVGLAAPDSQDHLIKRVIGLPGDHVVCCNAIGQVEVNGVPIDESGYLKLQPGKPAPEVKTYDVTVPTGSLWVLGDNRDRSQDSRYHTEEPGKGFVPIDNVVGRAFLITWPVAHLGSIDFHHDAFAGIPDPASDSADPSAP